MKIGILGAPGVGKTKFAEDLRELLVDGPATFVIIDDYVHDLQGRMGLEFGEFSSFVDDLQIVFKRREWEVHWDGLLKYGTITVGTVLDSVIHNFLRTESPTNDRYEIGLQQERLKAMAATFGLLYTETWDYDYAFFLPSDDTYGKAMSELIATYRAPVLTFLPGVTDDEKASTAAAAIRALEAPETPTFDERGVRQGREDGEDDGDSAESMSNVPEQGNGADDA